MLTQRRSVRGTLSEHQRALVAIGACVGSGCVSCLDDHVAEARTLGLADAAILRAIEDAECVKRGAYDETAAHAREVLGLAAQPPPDCCSDSTLEREFIWLGSAVAANATLQTQKHLDAARAQGITDEQIASVIMLAKQAQTCARRLLRKRRRS